MGKTGDRWGLEGAEAILKLRSFKVSNEFDDYWEYYLGQEFINSYENTVEDLEGIIQKIEKQVVSKQPHPKDIAIITCSYECAEKIKTAFQSKDYVYEWNFS